MELPGGSIREGVAGRGQNIELLNPNSQFLALASEEIRSDFGVVIVVDAILS